MFEADSVPDAVTAWLLQHGWPGFIILILCIAIIYMATQERARNKSIREENLELRKFIQELQDKRATELHAVASVSTKTISDFTAKAEAILSLAAKGRR